MKAIYKQEADLGDVEVIEWNAYEGEIIYSVEYSSDPMVDTSWYRDKAKAIAHAQFLAGRY